MERRSDGSHCYWVSNAGVKTAIKQMIEWGHQRWQVEQGYQQMKEELGRAAPSSNAVLYGVWVSAFGAGEKKKRS